MGWYGSYHVQFRLHRRLRRIDNLRQAFVEYLNLASDYWHNAEHDLHKRRGQEGRMIVAQLMIVTEHDLLAKSDGRAKKSYAETKSDRLRLWDAATGGCFGQVDWKPCPERTRVAGSAVAKSSSPWSDTHALAGLQDLTIVTRAKACAGSMP